MKHEVTAIGDEDKLEDAPDLEHLLELADEESSDLADFATARDNWQRLLPYLDNVRHLLPAVAVLGLLSSLLDGFGISLAILFLYTLLTGDGGGMDDNEGPFGALFQQVTDWTHGSPMVLGIALFVLMIARIVITTGYGLIASRVEQGINDFARQRLYRSLVGSPFYRVMTYRKGQLFAIFDRHVDAPSEVLDCYYGLTMSITACIVLGAMVIAASWPIALIAAAGSLLFMLATRPMQAAVTSHSQAAADAVSDMNGVLSNTLDAMRTIRIFGREPHFITRFIQKSRALRKVDMKLEVQTAFTEPLTELLYLSLIAATLGLTLYLDMPVLESLTAIALLSRLQPYVTEIETNRLSLAQMAVPLRVLSEFTSLNSSEYSEKDNKPPAPANPSITFDRISFAFGNQRVLSKASATIPKGQWTFISGPSGAGKSTLINLVAGLYIPDFGKILLDDVPLEAVARDSWLDQLGFAGQDVELFEGTIEENIRFGSPPSADMDEVLIDADIAKHIKTLPRGLDTPVTDRALDLSGGQRQRVGIARALFKRPKILLLDEATSAIDAASEKRVFAALRKRMAGATVIVISHHGGQMVKGDNLITLTPKGALEASVVA